MRPYENYTDEDLQLMLLDLERLAGESYGDGVQRQIAMVEAEIREREFDRLQLNIPCNRACNTGYRGVPFSCRAAAGSTAHSTDIAAC